MLMPHALFNDDDIVPAMADVQATMVTLFETTHREEVIATRVVMWEQ
jgi:hypothetical protein